MAAHELSLMALAKGVCERYGLDIEDPNRPDVQLAGFAWAAATKASAGLLRQREVDICKRAVDLSNEDPPDYDAALFQVTLQGGHQKIDNRLQDLWRQILQCEWRLEQLAEG